MANQIPPVRRSFLARLGAFALGAAAPMKAQSSIPSHLPSYVLAQDHKTLRQSSFDQTGGNNDSWSVPPGTTREVFNGSGPGIVTHIWFTIASPSPGHL